MQYPQSTQSQSDTYITISPQEFLNIDQSMLYTSPMKFSNSSLAFISAGEILIVEAGSLYELNEFILQLVHEKFYGIAVYLERLTLEQLMHLLYIEPGLISDDIKLQTLNKFECENQNNVSYNLQIKLALNHLNLN